MLFVHRYGGGSDGTIRNRRDQSVYQEVLEIGATA